MGGSGDVQSRNPLLTVRMTTAVDEVLLVHVRAKRVPILTEFKQNE